MSDTEEEAEETEPAVPLGDGPEIEGEPLARVASRLTWPAQKSDAIAQEGETTIRTPQGPRDLRRSSKRPTFHCSRAGASSLRPSRPSSDPAPSPWNSRNARPSTPHTDGPPWSPHFFCGHTEWSA